MWQYRPVKESGPDRGPQAVGAWAVSTHSCNCGIWDYGWLNNRNVFSHHSGGWKSRIKRGHAEAGLVPSEGCERRSVPCLSLTFWWYSRAPFSSLVYRSITWSLPSSSYSLLPVCMCIQISPSDKDTSHIDLILINYTCNDPTTKEGHI